MSSLNKKQAQQLISESTLQQYNRDISRNQNENRQNIHLNNTIQFSLQSVIGYHCSSSQCIKNSIRQSKSTESNKIFDNIPSKGIIGHIYNKNIYYYINNMFIRMNVYTRNTKPIYQQIQIEGKVQLLKFCDYGKQTIFMAIKRKADTLYMSIIWPDRIDSDKQFNSKQKATVYKIGQYKNKRVVNVGYHHEKKYLVFLWQEFVNGFTKQPQLQNSIQIFQINNKCIKVVLPLYNLKISKNSSKAKQTAYFQQSNLFKLTNVIILPDYKEIYIYGKQYFRYWSIDYHEKTMHASNFRGIERALKGQQVLTSYIFNKNKFQQPKRTDCNKQNNIIVALFTHKQCFFVKKNEIIKRINIPTESSLTVANLKNQATQLAIQKSLNQIYKSKFRMQTFSDNLQDMFDENADDNNNTKNRGTYICCISVKQWTEKSATFSEMDRKNEDNKKQLGSVL